MLTNNFNYTVEGGIVVHTMKDALREAAKAGKDEVFIIGGAAVFYESLPLTSKIYLTEVKAEVEGNVVYALTKHLGKR